MASSLSGTRRVCDLAFRPSTVSSRRLKSTEFAFWPSGVCFINAAQEDIFGWGCSLSATDTASAPVRYTHCCIVSRSAATSGCGNLNSAVRVVGCIGPLKKDARTGGGALLRESLSANWSVGAPRRWPRRPPRSVAWSPRRRGGHRVERRAGEQADDDADLVAKEWGKNGLTTR